MIRSHNAFALLTGLFAVLFTSGLHCQAQDLGFGYERRGNTIHFVSPKIRFGNSQIDQPDPATVRGFRAAMEHKFHPCRSVDAKTFKPLSEEYSLDVDRVFYKWISPGRFLVVELKLADRDSFEPLNANHARDKNHIWYLDRPIMGSDPISARLVDDRIIKDAKRVYISGEPQPHLHALTFRNIGSAYFVDLKGVYWGSEKIDGADQKSFRCLNNSFAAVDVNRVYLSGKVIRGIDPGSCELVKSFPYGYSILKDKTGVFLNNVPFLNSDPDDHKILDPITAIGNNRVYLVDRYQMWPFTLSMRGQVLMFETLLFTQDRTKPIAVLKGKVTPNGLTDISTLPPPGLAKAGTVADWQMSVLKRGDLYHTMLSKQHLLEKPK